jgi:hypothetical protein
MWQPALRLGYFFRIQLINASSHGHQIGDSKKGSVLLSAAIPINFCGFRIGELRHH